MAKASGMQQNRVDPLDLLKVAEKAAQAGAEVRSACWIPLEAALEPSALCNITFTLLQVVLKSASQPKSITRKDGNDVVTETDKGRHWHPVQWGRVEPRQPTLFPRVATP